MKAPQFSPEVLQALQGKALVVRLVVDTEGKVTEVTPLTQEKQNRVVPPDVLATIQSWEFSPSRKEAGEWVKYYSFKPSAGRNK
jgi:hypothetical protein